MVPLITILRNLLGELVLPAPTTMGSVALNVLIHTIGHRKHPSVLSIMTTTWNTGLTMFIYKQARKGSNTIDNQVMHWDAFRYALAQF